NNAPVNSDLVSANNAHDLLFDLFSSETYATFKRSQQHISGYPSLRCGTRQIWRGDKEASCYKN
ncbi:MAG: hypothetical protein MN733_33835, partial [Nitrososphaera sp.]|nr:hypothetical protein [Nitrososphaera sp.]